MWRISPGDQHALLILAPGCAFDCRIEQAFRFEFGLEFFEGRIQGTQPGATHRINRQLEFAASRFNSATEMTVCRVATSIRSDVGRLYADWYRSPQCSDTIPALPARSFRQTQIGQERFELHMFLV